MTCSDPAHRRLEAEVRQLREDVLVLEDALREAEGRPRPKRRGKARRHSRFERAQIQAADRGIDWYISATAYEALILQPCTYCGRPVGGGVGLDRLDNDGPYATDNVVPCCWPCNKALQNGTITRFAPSGDASRPLTRVSAP